MLKNWNSLNTKQKAYILILFVERNNRVPRNIENYNGNLVGNFWKNIKYSNNPYYKKIYNNILSKNKILFEDYNKI